MKLVWKLLIIATALLIVDVLRYFIYPDVSVLRDEQPLPTAFMQYREHQWAEEGNHQEIRHKWVSIERISPNIVKAVLIGEDDGFYHHDGFDIKGMENAIERSIEKGTLAGGSTISQQLSKNLYLTPSKNPIRKLKEAIITWRIEKTLSKRRILEIYLNVAEWGDGIFGIEAAARHYYHKSAKNLTAREASRLAAVLPNPIKYNPTGNQRYVKNRARIIYKIMKRRGVIQLIYKEVMRESKAQEQISDINETSSTIGELFNETENSQDTPASPQIQEENTLHDSNDTAVF